MSRPSKFTPERRRAIVQAMRLGATYEIAADSAGVTRKTLWSWIKKAQEKNAPKSYVTFLHEVKKATADCALNDLKTLQEEAIKGNWKCSAWRLERRFGYKRESVHAELDTANEKPQEIELTPETLLSQQARDLKTAILKAEKSESWQAYAALQRQLLQVTLQLKAMKDSEGESWQSMTDMEILNEITNTIQILPPVLKQALLDEMTGLGGNVVKLPTKK